ncbi:hypothetical protein SDC9_165118 [bioreactor metagenome]|uniref:Uncharacterized protein n=1 Tax=bioreactor metagenome TaxID=1076179 RepID=A0A645G0R1_9ZZZZ
MDLRGAVRIIRRDSILQDQGEDDRPPLGSHHSWSYLPSPITLRSFGRKHGECWFAERARIAHRKHELSCRGVAIVWLSGGQRETFSGVTKRESPYEDQVGVFGERIGSILAEI